MSESKPPVTQPDPTTLPTDPKPSHGDTHVDSLKKAYEKAVEVVDQTPPGTPEYFKAREAKKAAFVKYNEAANTNQELNATVALAEQKKAAADAAVKEAEAAKKAASAKPVPPK